jgi:hypothetical protein
VPTPGRRECRSDARIFLGRQPHCRAAAEFFDRIELAYVPVATSDLDRGADPNYPHATSDRIPGKKRQLKRRFLLFSTQHDQSIAFLELFQAFSNPVASRLLRAW